MTLLNDVLNHGGRRRDTKYFEQEPIQRSRTSTLYRLLFKIFSFSACNYADQIGKLSTVACYKTRSR